MHMICYPKTNKTKHERCNKRLKTGVRGIVIPKSSKRSAYEESLGFQPIYTNKTQKHTKDKNRKYPQT